MKNMKNNDKFIKFLEAIKTDENKALVNTVIQGFNSCCENGMFFGGVSPVKASTGMINNIPGSKVKLDDVDVSDAELPVEPNVGYENSDDTLRKQSIDDIMKLVEFIKKDPRGAEILKEIVEKEF